MEERYRATTQNRFYPAMSNVLVNKKYYSGGNIYQPTYVKVAPEIVTMSSLAQQPVPIQ